MPELRSFERRSEPVGSCSVCGAPIYAGCEHIKNLNQTIEPIKETGPEVKYVGGYREPPPDAKLEEDVGSGMGIYKREWTGKRGKISEEFEIFPVKYLPEDEKLRAATAIEGIERGIPTLKKEEGRPIYSSVLKEWSENDNLKEALSEKKADQIAVLQALLSDIEMTVRARKGVTDPKEIQGLIKNAFEKVEKRYGIITQ